jgi:hypothetical protein
VVFKAAAVEDAGSLGASIICRAYVRTSIRESHQPN